MMNRNNLFNKPSQPARYTFCDRKQFFEKNLLLVFPNIMC